MNDQMVLIVRLGVEKSVRNVVRDNLIELFERIKDESTFVKATLHEDLEDPEQLLVYEVWRESRESFMVNQISKPYRINYEKVLLDLRVERTAQWLKPAGSWNSRGCG
jgi:quinol monooxygenase YgiN